MFVTVFPPIVDVVLAGVSLLIVSFWTGVFLFAGVARLMDRLAPSLFDPAAPVELPAPAVPIGVLEEEVAS